MNRRHIRERVLIDLEVSWSVVKDWVDPREFLSCSKQSWRYRGRGSIDKNKVGGGHKHGRTDSYKQVNRDVRRRLFGLSVESTFTAGKLLKGHMSSSLAKVSTWPTNYMSNHQRRLCPGSSESLLFAHAITDLFP